MKKYTFSNKFDKESDEIVSYAMNKSAKLRPNLASYKGNCVTIAKRNLFVTFAHGCHDSLRPGETLSFPVKLFNGAEIRCRVIKRCKQVDFVWLRPENPHDLPQEIKDLRFFSPHIYQKVIILGCSGQCKFDDFVWFDICEIAHLVQAGRGRENTINKSCPGESGAPVFDLYSGQLVGMQTLYNCINESSDDANYFDGKGEIIPAYLFCEDPDDFELV